MCALAGITLAVPATAASAGPASSPGACTSGYVWDENPYGVAVNPRTNTIYVVEKQGGDSPYNVAVIDGTTLTQTANITVNVGYAQPIAVDPDTGLVYLGAGANGVEVINGQTNQITATIPVPAGGNVFGVAVDPKTDRIYATVNGTNSILVINGKSNKVLRKIKVGPGGWTVAADPLTDMVYVGDSNGLTVINASTNRVVTTISGVTSQQLGLAVNTRTDTIYAASSGGFTAVSGKTNTVLAQFTDPELYGMAVNQRANLVYVTNIQTGYVFEVSGRTYQITGPAQTMEEPTGIAFNPATGGLYAASNSYLYASCEQPALTPSG
jgi:DNA-binding beta-propeller fold protein YncE